MDKKAIALLLILILPIASAQDEITDLTPTDSGLTIEEQQQNLVQAQEAIKRHNELMSTIQLTQAQNSESLVQAVNYLDGQMSQYQSTNIIVTILVVLAGLGMWWAVFLHFKARKLI